MEFIALDYTTLRVIWWLLLGILLVGWAVMDGFDLGVGTLLPFVARTDDERRLVINTVGPVWKATRSGWYWVAARSSRRGPRCTRSASPASTSLCS